MDNFIGKPICAAGFLSANGSSVLQFDDGPPKDQGVKLEWKIPRFQGYGPVRIHGVFDGDHLGVTKTEIAVIPPLTARFAGSYRLVVPNQLEPLLQTVRGGRDDRGWKPTQLAFWWRTEALTRWIEGPVAADIASGELVIRLMLAELNDPLLPKKSGVNVSPGSFGE